MVERQLPKLHTGVRFPSPAFRGSGANLRPGDQRPKSRRKERKNRPGADDAFGGAFGAC